MRKKFVGKLFAEVARTGVLKFDGNCVAFGTPLKMSEHKPVVERLLYVGFFS